MVVGADGIGQRLVLSTVFCGVNQFRIAQVTIPTLYIYMLFFLYLGSGKTIGGSLQKVHQQGALETAEGIEESEVY